ncbi:hypothetical protein EI94DRAFT_965883 [Lactarius quietus]|nr:hypothetical protein EI94DRAFT_965883 [Lactarius quietus]
MIQPNSTESQFISYLALVMSPLPADVDPLFQELDAMFITDEGFPVIYPQVADAAARLQAMSVTCCQLLRTLDTPHSISSASRYSTISDTHRELELVRLTCTQLLQVLESPYNASNTVPLGEHQVLREPAFSGINHQVILTATQLKFVRATHNQLLQVYGSLNDESSATQFGTHQVFPDPAISQVVTDLKYVLVAGPQLLQVYGILASEYDATLPGELNLLADNVLGSNPRPPDHATANIQNPGSLRTTTRQTDCIASTRIARRPLVDLRNASDTWSMFTRCDDNARSAVTSGLVPEK